MDAMAGEITTHGFQELNSIHSGEQLIGDDFYSWSKVPKGERLTNQTIASKKDHVQFIKVEGNDNHSIKQKLSQLYASQSRYPTPNEPRAVSLSLAMELLDLLNLIIRTHKDTGLVMDILRYDLEHAVHLAIDGLTTSCFDIC